MDARIRISAPGHPDAPLPLLERGVAAVLDESGVSEAEVSLTLVGDEAIRGLNREYLGRDRPTDVLAFPLYEADEPVVGDIYIGVEQARRQADDHGVSLDEELVRLAVHGALHVLGHDHPEGDDRKDSPMYRLQESLVAVILQHAS